MADGKVEGEATGQAASFEHFQHLPRELQWRVAQQSQHLDSISPLVAVSTQIRDLLVEYASKVELVVNTNRKVDSDSATAAASFLGRVCQEGKEGLKLQIRGVPENISGNDLRTLLHPSSSTGGWIKVHNLQLAVSKHT
jgi:hypothetical protein